MTSEPSFQPFESYQEYPLDEMVERSQTFYEEVRRRRSIRDFDSRPVPRTLIENCIRAAGTAPCGANQQPWHFAIAESQEVKREIRLAAEEEERSFYQERAPEEWLDALRPLGTDDQKPFLESAPYLIAIFGQQYSLTADDQRTKHYYVNESVGIATGILITALHHAGLATLTHTPSPMKFLNQILDRPANERPFLLLVVGYPAQEAEVPVISKKPLAEISSVH